MAKPVAQRGSARQRLLDAAVDLFAEHGVNGTSLQMIATRLGITKASVYYQFQSKDAIVRAAVQPAFDDITRLITIVESLSTREAQQETAITGLIESAVRHRRVSAILTSDPGVITAVAGNAECSEKVTELADLIIGPDPSVVSRVAWAMLQGGLSSVATDSSLQSVDDAELRRALLACAKPLLAAQQLNRKEHATLH